MKSFLYKKSSQKNPTTLHDHIDDHDDEGDETLSLCDLEIYNDAATSQEFTNKENEICSLSSSSSSSLQQDLFEFFTEEWSSSSLVLPSNNPPENIIFCGKLIPSKQMPVPFSPTRFPSNPTKPKKSRGLFRWNSDKHISESNTRTPPRSKSLPVKGKYGGKNDIVPKRVSIFQSPTKSRLFLFLFGMGRFPTKMELSDIRSRQVRRSPSIMFRMNGGDENEHEEVGGSGRMRLIRALGCSGGGGGGNQINAVGKNSVSCFGGV